MGEIVGAHELARRLTVTPATVHAWHRRSWIPVSPRRSTPSIV